MANFNKFPEIPIADPKSALDLDYFALKILGKQTPTGVLDPTDDLTNLKEIIKEKLDKHTDLLTDQIPIFDICKKFKPKYSKKFFNKMEKKMSVRKLLENDELPVVVHEDEAPSYYLRRKISKNAFKNLKSLQEIMEIEYASSESQGRGSGFEEKVWFAKTLPKQHQEADISPLEEIVFTLVVYKPYTVENNMKPIYRTLPRINQEVEVLGSQTLDQLRDVIFCPNDNYKEWDFSLSSNGDHIAKAKELYKSGFFYFEDTFYNDMRHSSNIDYSEVIRNWRRDSNPFTDKMTGKMEHTKFSELKLSFGYPYVYQHQGNCEHLIVFKQARLIGLGDERHSTSYPRYNTPYKMQNVNCYMCGIYPAVWLTRDNDLPHDPALFCSCCYQSFNYDKTGKKINEFSSHPFIQNTPLPDQDIQANVDSTLEALENKEAQTRKRNICKPLLFSSKELQQDICLVRNETVTSNTESVAQGVGSASIVAVTAAEDPSSGVRKRCGRRRYSEESVDFVQPADSHPALHLANITGYSNVDIITDAEQPRPKRKYKKRVKRNESIFYDSNLQADGRILVKKYHEHLDETLKSIPRYKAIENKMKKREKEKKCDKCIVIPQEGRKSKLEAMKSLRTCVCNTSKKTRTKSDQSKNKSSSCISSTSTSNIDPLTSVYLDSRSSSSIPESSTIVLVDPLICVEVDDQSGTLHSSYMHDMKMSPKNTLDDNNSECNNTQINEIILECNDINDEELNIKQEIKESIIKIIPSTSSEVENTTVSNNYKKEYYRLQTINGENILFPAE